MLELRALHRLHIGPVDLRVEAGECESIDNSGKLADGTNKSNNKGNESECGNDRRNSTERNLHNFLHIARTRPAGRVLYADQRE